uniref:G_PROTEIN_RECEP_F1_2 domain-containing protein n=1 Tax=Panagrellus redivivus TaxID=6233 RepID=A0A7E4W9Q2_PANRE
MEPASRLVAGIRRITVEASTAYPSLSPSPEPVGYSLFDDHPVIAVIIIFLVSLLILATIIGNAMVCLAVLMVRKLKQQPANLLLISLAVADFSVGLFVMPIALVSIIEDHWILGEVVCRFWTSADLTLCTASILNLCMISVDRYLVVTRPLRYAVMRTSKRILFYIAIVWIGALLVSAAPLIVLPWRRIERTCQVPQNSFYQIYATIISFYAPCTVMVVLYMGMWQAAKKLRCKDRLATKWSLSLRDDSNNNSAGATEPRNSVEFASEVTVLNGNGKQSKRGSATSTPARRHHRPSNFFHAVRMPLMHTRSTERNEDKARKTLGIIMSVFIICWLPFFILALLKSQKLVDYLPRWLDALTLWLGYSNSMLNPLIYCKYNREFRIPFREMLCCRFRTIQDVMRHESFKSKFGPPSGFRLPERKKVTDELLENCSARTSTGTADRVDHI